MTLFLQRVACVFIASVVMAEAAFGQTQRQDTAPAAVFTRYCTGCHNAKLKTAGLIIDPENLTHVGTEAEIVGEGRYQAA